MQKQLSRAFAEFDIALELYHLEFEERDDGFEVKVDGLDELLRRDLPRDVVLDDGVFPSVDEVFDDGAHLVDGHVDFHLGLHDLELRHSCLDLVEDLLLHLPQRLQNDEECLLDKLLWDLLRYFAHLPDDVVELAQFWILVAFLVGPVLLVSSYEALRPRARLGVVLPLNDPYLILEELLFKLVVKLCLAAMFGVLLAEAVLRQLIVVVYQSAQLLADANEVELIQITVVCVQGFNKLVLADLECSDCSFLLRKLADLHALLRGQVRLLHELLDCLVRHALQPVLEHVAHQLKVSEQILLILLCLLALIILEHLLVDRDLDGNVVHLDEVGQELVQHFLVVLEILVDELVGVFVVKPLFY